MNDTHQKRQGITEDQHRKYASQLARMKDELGEMKIEVCKALGPTHKDFKYLDRTHERVKVLYSRLSCLPDADPIYYPQVYKND